MTAGSALPSGAALLAEAVTVVPDRFVVVEAHLLLVLVATAGLTTLLLRAHAALATLLLPASGAGIALSLVLVLLLLLLLLLRSRVLRLLP